MEIMTGSSRSNNKLMKEEEEEETAEVSGTICCFFCAMKDRNPCRRRSALAGFFDNMPRRDDEADVLVLSALWNIAMTRPDDPELPSLGALRCMSLLIAKAVADPAWLRCHQNVYIPYYAAHVLGSYTIRLPELAALAVDAGAVQPLLDLLRGSITWVEQRVAVRALGHLASYDVTFPAVARRREEVVELAMRAASTCLARVHSELVAAEPGDRVEYHRDLLTRGLGGPEAEVRRAEEWASQLQCWSLYLLCCLAHRDTPCRRLILRREAGFVRELSGMWGGLANGDSPAGVGLMRILCRSAEGRAAVARSAEAMESLCNLARSSDDWQYMGVDCLLLLLDDRKTRRVALEIAAPCLVDLAELETLGARKRIGDAITTTLLLDYDATKMAGETAAERAIKFLWELKVERKNRESRMSEEEIAARSLLSSSKKRRGNKEFRSGSVEAAVVRYGEALEVCPVRSRKERVVLYSNRAQCWVLMREADAAISDATRALALARPANRHARSLWRRAQAYDMKRMAKESLLDTIMFVNVLMTEKKKKKQQQQQQWRSNYDCNAITIPYYAARMINKQMNAAGLFAGLADDTNKKKKTMNCPSPSSSTSDIEGSICRYTDVNNKLVGCGGLLAIEEEAWLGRRGSIKGKGDECIDNLLIYS
ncbi:uncharacterized protein LOC122037357 [Zingiber officinale]|uniref:uncharacterized protein LOC122037357 n=1 Tax=Zingiber officinale TaxID=94328 RepID=UPI001C4DB797|nr:uncharacterized protein LOC122037357 [Zingiber officinale]